jgi:hypothetical protein
MENNEKDGSQISEGGNGTQAVKPSTKIRIIEDAEPPEKQLRLMTFGEPGLGDSKFPASSSASARGPTFCAG